MNVIGYNISLGRWTHPSTGQVRVYVNGLGREFGKLFFGH